MATLCETRLSACSLVPKVSYSKGYVRICIHLALYEYWKTIKAQNRLENDNKVTSHLLYWFDLPEERNGHPLESKMVLSRSGQHPPLVLLTKDSFKCDSDCTNFKSHIL